MNPKRDVLDFLYSSTKQGPTLLPKIQDTEDVPRVNIIIQPFQTTRLSNHRHAVRRAMSVEIYSTAVQEEENIVGFSTSSHFLHCIATNVLLIGLRT